MADHFLSPPSKRTLPPDHHHTLSPSKRPKHQLRPPISAGYASLRIICHASHIGGLIGKSGSTIKSLQLDTGSKIRVDDSLRPSSDHRVILIVAPTSPSLTVKLRKRPDDVAESEVEFGEKVSGLQVAALRVFEKVLEVSNEADSGSVSVQVLIDGAHAGFVIGKGGKFVQNLKRESGAKIRILDRDKLPPFVSSPDNVVEIEGDLLAVKKGLLGVCGRLQLCPQGDKSSDKESEPVETISQPTIPEFHVDPLLQRPPRSLYMANLSPNPVTMMRPLSFEVDQRPSMESKPHQQEVVFKILCSNDRVGGVIGKGGSIVHALQEETGAHISVGPSVTNCDERLVTVTANEDVDTRNSPAQRAVILVYSRLCESFAGKGLDTGSNENSSVSARLLVASGQVGCLLGKGGTIVSEMRKTSGANIRILKGDQVPKCAADNDHVVEITGEFFKILDALHQVTSRLRSDLFPSDMRTIVESQTNASLARDASGHERVRVLPIGVHHFSETSHSIDGLYTMRQGLDSMPNHQRLDHSRLPGSLTSPVALDARFHGRVRDLPIGMRHYSDTSLSLDGQSTMRQDLDSVYDRRRLDHYPLARFRVSEVALDASGNGRFRDLPTDVVHHSSANSHSIDGRSTMRQGLDSSYNHQILGHSPLAGPRASDVALEASRHGRVKDLPFGVHHSSATPQSIDGMSTTRHDLDHLYDRQRWDHLPLEGSRTSEIALNASRHGIVRDLPIGVHNSFVTSQSNDGISTMRQGLDSFYNAQRLDHSSLSRSQTSESGIGVNSRSFVNLGSGLAPANGGAKLGSLNRPAIVTNTTVEISVPGDAISSVYGENGRNLMRIRQISGAKVVVHEAAHGTRDRTVSISGTPDQTQAAQSLLHAFILTRSS